MADEGAPVGRTGCRRRSTDAAVDRAGLAVGDDVAHPDHGHGWIQGAGHGVMTVRFETRSTGPGIARTFPDNDAGGRPRQPGGQPRLAGLRRGVGAYQNSL